jgi:hypothetical protein
MKHKAFNILYFICIAIFIIGELRTPWLILVFFAGAVVKYRLTKDIIEPIDKASESPYAWLYHHGRQWALGHHIGLNPHKCTQCKAKL